MRDDLKQAAAGRGERRVLSRVVNEVVQPLGREEEEEARKRKAGRGTGRGDERNLRRVH